MSKNDDGLRRGLGGIELPGGGIFGQSITLNESDNAVERFLDKEDMSLEDELFAAHRIAKSTIKDSRHHHVRNGIRIDEGEYVRDHTVAYLLLRHSADEIRAMKPEMEKLGIGDPYQLEASISRVSSSDELRYLSTDGE